MHLIIIKKSRQILCLIFNYNNKHLGFRKAYLINTIIKFKPFRRIIDTTSGHNIHLLINIYTK